MIISFHFPLFFLLQKLTLGKHWPVSATSKEKFLIEAWEISSKLTTVGKIKAICVIGAWEKNDQDDQEVKRAGTIFFLNHIYFGSVQGKVFFRSYSFLFPNIIIVNSANLSRFSCFTHIFIHVHMNL